MGSLPQVSDLPSATAAGANAVHRVTELNRGPSRGEIVGRMRPGWRQGGGNAPPRGKEFRIVISPPGISNRSSPRAVLKLFALS